MNVYCPGNIRALDAGSCPFFPIFSVFSLFNLVEKNILTCFIQGYGPGWILSGSNLREKNPVPDPTFEKEKNRSGFDGQEKSDPDFDSYRTRPTKINSVSDTNLDLIN